MGVFTYETEVVTEIPAAKMFKAGILDGDNLVPKIVPQAIKSVEYIEGTGGPGTIKKVTFAEGSPFNYMKQVVETVDEEKFVFSYSVIEGDMFMEKLEKISYEIKLESSPSGGSICKMSNKYYTVGDSEIPEEGVKDGKANALAIFKALEAYLLANPDAY